MEKDDENYIPEDIDTSLTKEDKDLDEIKAEEEPVNEPAEEIKIQVKAPDSEQTVDMPVMPSVVRRKMTVLEWLNAMNWRSNPFIFNIVPSLFVGYKSQTERISMALEEKHKFMLILGPTGSGKTTLLKWLSFKLKKYDVLYIGKPPQKPEEFVEIISSKYRAPWYAFWSKKIRSIYEIPDFLNKKLGRKTLVILLDEAHEANTDILEWLRVLNDQVENMSIVMSGLPVFEESLKNSLETFKKSDGKNRAFIAHKRRDERADIKEDNPRRRTRRRIFRCGCLINLRIHRRISPRNYPRVRRDSEQRDNERKHGNRVHCRNSSS